MTVARRHPRLVALFFAFAAAALTASSANAGNTFPTQQTPAMGSDHDRGASGRYAMQALVSDGVVSADHTDADLVNPWGISFNPNGPVWIADNHSGLSTLYDGNGNKLSLVVTIPPPAGGDSPSAPTGIAFNSSSDFAVSEGENSGPARFLFATEDGTISGWAPNVDSKNAILKVDNSGSGAIYKGLALAGNGSGHFLYATDFHNARIDVFDATFAAASLPGAFRDPHIPAGYAPFGIQNVNGDLYVTYAKQDSDKVDDVPGRGFGFLDVFDSNGNLIRRLASRGQLNAPWGMALAPADFGRFSNDLLIGNFGDGTINAFDLESGNFRGQLRGEDNRPLVIDGLWGLSFGNGVLDQPTNALFVTAGPDDESHGIYARIDPIPGGGN